MLARAPMTRFLARPALTTRLLPQRAVVLLTPPALRVASTGSAVSHATKPPLHRLFSATHAGREEKQEPVGTPIGQVEPKLSLTFTCSVTDCGHRSTHEFTRRSYERGIVIVQCPGCKNRHLIADHLSWFTENASDPKTIEQMIEAKGGKVKRGINYVDGNGYETVEIYNEGDSSKQT